VVINVNPMCVLNYLVAELGDSNEEFKLVENDLTWINVLWQEKLGVLCFDIYEIQSKQHECQCYAGFKCNTYFCV